MTLRFRCGVLATINLSDTIASPWSWEHGASENRAYPRVDQPFMHIGGTRGALALPGLEFWSHEGEQNWLNPLKAERISIPEQDPLACQIAHFCRVIRGEAPPLVTGRDGLNNLLVVAAVKRAVRSKMIEDVFAR